MNKNNSSHKEILQIGKNTDFWKIIVAGIERELDKIEEDSEERDMSKLPADQYKLENEIKIFKSKFLKRLQKYPEELILYETDTFEPEKNFDPYRSVWDF